MAGVVELKSTARALRVGDAIGPTLAAAVPLVLYALTMPRTVVLEDDGLFLMAGAYLGIAHPPGYPLYTLICHLFMQLPFGTPAVLGHLSSAVLGAASCALVYGCARLLDASRIPALTAALLFGASEHVWSQAIIAEVYTLHTLLFFAVYALLLHAARRASAVPLASVPSLRTARAKRGVRSGRAGRHPRHERAVAAATPVTPAPERWIWCAAAAAYGLSLANHWPLLVLATPGLLLAALPAWRSLVRQWRFVVAGLLPSVVLPYAWMVWRSHRQPLISFYGPIENLQELWFFIARQGYAHVDRSPSAGWLDRLQFLHWFGNELLWQMTLPGFALAVLGLIVLFRRGKRAAAGSGLLALLGNSVALVMLLGFDFEFLNVAKFRPYTVVCYGLQALWLALGLQFLLDRCPAWLPFRPPPWLAPAAAGLAGAAMVAGAAYAHYQVNDRADSDYAQRYAEMVFDHLPPDAMVFTYGDFDSVPLGYFHFVEQVRPDITLINTQGLIFANRPYDWRVSEARKQAILRALVSETERPIFYAGSQVMASLGFAARSHGFIKELVGDVVEERVDLTVGEPAIAYFEELLQFRSHDRWELNERNEQLRSFGGILGLVVYSRDTAMLEHVQGPLAQAEGNFYLLAGMLEIMVELGDASHYQQIERWLQQAHALQDDTVSKKLRARIRYLEGFLRHRQGRTEEAAAAFRESATIYPHPDNDALTALREWRGGNLTGRLTSSDSRRRRSDAPFPAARSASRLPPSSLN